MSPLVAAATMLAAACAVGWGGPYLLAAGRWQVHRPRTALALWQAALTLACALAAGSVAVAVAAAGPAGGLAGHAAGWGMLVAAGGVLSAVGSGGERVHDAARTNAGAVLALPHTAHLIGRRLTLRVCRTDEPFACCIPGRHAVILVSQGLADTLTPAQLRAVIAHETAHLHARHARLLRAADLAVACMPHNRAARRARRAVGLLVELAADQHAARHAGAVHLANALQHIAQATGEQTLPLRAALLADRAWHPASRLPAVPVLYRTLTGPARH